MPGSEAVAQGSSASSRGQQVTRGGERPNRSTPQPGEHSPHEPPNQSTNQIHFPVMMVSPRATLISSSHLQALILQQCAGDPLRKQLLQLAQQRPSVLRGGGRQNQPLCPLQPGASPASSLAQPCQNSSPAQSSDSSLCKSEPGGSRSAPSPHHGASARSSPTPRRLSPAVQTARNHSPTQKVSEAPNTLFVSGLCKWPGCEEVFEEYGQFIKHLHRDHSPDEKSLAQWRVQKEVVLQLENQLTVERQRLRAMQLHLHFTEHRLSTSNTKMREASENSFSAHGFPLSQPRLQERSSANHKEAVEVGRHGYWHLPTIPFMPEMVPSMDYYKYSNIRPPFTYASLIRWAILESPDKQLTLNEIYHWFMNMFAFFRFNTATWKNAVRHNLSLHKCFVRVEGGKGAVWTVDETEFQRRRGQKFNRDQDVKWLGPYAYLCPQEPWSVSQPGSS
ncbi:forkhead box protein P3-like [Acipenser ruthenus]|uniref:forkhead box protein P3-like n=1 Tax=Acipenser ruthenus TaxID=7906 RepID=UPI0015600F84|nr:forkhead box protein P3-like [Acipenser ruthenus]XP_033863015.2 forkhead box protein P3-like [Acipenser ruthenus]